MCEQTKPVLMIPVYNGGDYFAQLLVSLAPAEHLFKNVVISFNGEAPNKDEATLKKSLVNHFSNLIVLRTLGPLCNIQHMHFWTSFLNSKFKQDDPIFNLCHDDLLNYSNTRYFLENNPNLTNVCVLGDWEIFMDESHKKIRLGSTFPPNATELNVCHLLAWQNSRLSNKKKFTNMSGLLVPLLALSEASAIYNFVPGSYGARMEYCLATSKHNKRIIRAFPPLVKVRDHQNQAGKNVPKAQEITDELIYRFWLILNLKGYAFREHCLRGPLNIYKANSLVIKYIAHKIKNLFRVK
jgi:hypothetical protein